MDTNKIFKQWMESGNFARTPGFGKHANESFTVVIPPPNITGKLHMGHALNDAIQDAIIRRARMQGYQTRWVLGTDHAGIATQTKVDKHLAEQGINRREIGREKFIEACQEWRREYGTTIVNQIKEMGCSVDYDRENFTMSDEFSKAVRKLFVDWYHNGLIYRGKRIVNWCPHCTTAIADDEAEYEDEHGHLWYMKYPIEDSNDYVMVATTRPETMLGDTGIAVSPKDKRYKDLVGKNVILPLVDRKIPVFEDFYVDAEFGTGCVKVTPAHDPNDYQMGVRHDLPRINIFDETAHVVEGYGKYTGMSALQAREAIVADFEELGLLDHIEDLDHSVMHCYRCHTTLEPWESEQWFVDVDELKPQAFEVVDNGEIKFFPERWKNVYKDWLENLKDWCISRQLWWGHQIPMYYCDECGWQDASVEKVETCPKCGAKVRQDEDVLDTWFSSQLWPFATQGWAEGELTEHYPTQVLSTARDIMGLWVARMVMASMYCTDQIPFEHVLIHPTVMGADGKPMSKSRGNGVDPIDLIENYGADAMRFGLLTQVTGAQAMRFDYQKIEQARNFANKIKNASKFVLMNIEGDVPAEPEPKTTADRWILSRLSGLVQRLDKAYSTYEFSEVTRELYSFIWNEFCDWYIEFSKTDKNPSVLVYVLTQSLKLLHPIMPFITEEIYQELPNKETNFLMMAPWPDVSFEDAEAEASINVVCGVVGAVRSIRARYGLSPKQKLDIAVNTNDDLSVELLDNQAAFIKKLANVGDMQVGVGLDKPDQSSVSIAGNLEIYIILTGLVDFEKEKARLNKELKAAQKDEAMFSKKLSNPGFLNNAKPEIIEKDKAKLANLQDTIERLNSQIAELG
ncbi:MAG: valine--tRNA ligase [Coriobacteriia bacterium]|nr:valine--tRNA ligase [Coriobacteriia bacterium]